MCIALARAPTWQSGRSASAHAGRPDRKHHRVAWVRAVRWRCWPGLAVNMDQIGTYFNKVLISIVSLSGILTWTPHNDPFVAMYSQWLASGRPGGLLCVRLVWCGLYDGAAYLSTSESYLRDLGVVWLIPRAAYRPEITVIIIASLHPGVKWVPGVPGVKWVLCKFDNAQAQAGKYICV